MKKGIIIVLIVLTILISWWSINSHSGKSTKEANLNEYVFPSDKAETFNISGGNSYPLFIKDLIIDPAASPLLQTVNEGERQTYSVWVQDPGGVTGVRAEIENDEDTIILAMELVEGSEAEGKWQGSWITNNISLKKEYKTVFEAMNKNKDKSSITLIWSTEN